MAEDGNDHGINEVGATMHWGPDGDNNKYYLTHGERYDADNEIRLHFRVSDMRKTAIHRHIATFYVIDHLSALKCHPQVDTTTEKL